LRDAGRDIEMFNDKYNCVNQDMEEVKEEIEKLVELAKTTGKLTNL
jgi:hypothetical protein